MSNHMRVAFLRVTHGDGTTGFFVGPVDAIGKIDEEFIEISGSLDFTVSDNMSAQGLMDYLGQLAERADSGYTH